MKVTTLLVCVLVGITCLVESVPLNVHIVPHTHDDVGWLKTPDEYYYGANTSIQDAGVQYIIDTVVMALQANPNRKFIYVEIAFFYRWWREQSAATQAVVKQLVANGQLEFINGGWTMHDEACVHFEDMVDQMTLGHQFLKNTFNIVPKIGWQLDPFGHSSTSAIIDSLIGFEALFFARMDYQDLAAREANKGLELMWNPSASITNISLLTGMMYGGYCSPDGFMFEYGDAPIQDDPLLEDYNLVQKAQQFMKWSTTQANLMRHNDIMLSWGCDFMYQNAHMMYKNIEKLMTYINNNQQTYNARLFYSTPTIYAQAIKSANPTLPTKSDDFMPYADNSHSYWSGYFTSRSTLKGFVRYSSHILHAVSSLLSVSQITSSNLVTQLFAVQQPNGVATHHDAVSGTEKQHVADDYAKNLNIANTNAYAMFNQIYGQLITSKAPPTFTFCPLLNESLCNATTATSGVIPIVVYNPQGWSSTQNIRLPIAVTQASVTDSNNTAVQAQVIPVKTASGAYEIVFVATVPALGFSTFFLHIGTSSEATEVSSVYQPEAGFTLSNQYLTVSLDTNGFLQSVKIASTGVTVPIQQSYQYYVSNPGDSVSRQASGAYIFRPATQESYPFAKGTPSISGVINGSIVTEVRRYFQPDLSQIIRLYTNQNYIEIVDVIGPIDISDGKGKEVVTRYTTNFNSANTWYSDSNGIELIQRKLNYRPSWNFTVVEPVAGNYVPVNAITSINDVSSKLQLTVVVDRSRSSASLTNGQLETMLHRRCLVDDGRGVGEPLNESTIMSSTEWLVVTSTSDAARIYRPLAKRAYHPFVLGFGPSTPAPTWISQYKTSFSPLGITVPSNVQILDFVPLGSATYILRLHHIYQVGEDSVMSQPVTVDISQLLSAYPIVFVLETQLTAVSPATREDAIKMKVDAPTPIPVVLNPTEIRTFLITTKPSDKSVAFDNPPSPSIHIN